MFMPAKPALIALLLAISWASVTSAQPTDALDAAVYAGQDLFINGQSRLVAGPGVSNRDLFNNSVLTAQDLYIGGSYRNTLGGTPKLRLTGDLTALGDVDHLNQIQPVKPTDPPIGIAGSVYAGGSVTAEQVNIGGSVTATGDVSFTSNANRIVGDVTTGGYLNIQGEVQGTATYNTGFELGGFAFVGTLQQGGPVAPPTFNPPALPTPRTITPGSSDLDLAPTQQLALAPGRYGSLNFSTENLVTLSAGTYTFTNITNTVPQNFTNFIDFDTSAGPITVLIAGDLNFPDVFQRINGKQPLTTDPDAFVANPQLFAPREQAANIFWQVDGDLTTTGDSLYGTFYTPTGNALIAESRITGSVIGGRDVILKTSDVYHVRTSVPEPGSAALLGLAAAAVTRRRRGANPQPR